LFFVGTLIHKLFFVDYVLWVYPHPHFVRRVVRRRIVVYVQHMLKTCVVQ